MHRLVWSAGALATALALNGCGGENFVPANAGDYGLRGGAETVLVLDNTPADTQGYMKIGIGLAHAKSQSAALKKCRSIAADNGGDAILLPEAKTPRDWDCAVLRASVPHSGRFHTKKEFVVYESPESGSQEITKLPAGTEIEMQRRQDTWAKIQWDGPVDELPRGWVHFSE